LRYNRADVCSSILAAESCAKKHNRTYYVVPTYYGYKVTYEEPAGFQGHYKVEPDGRISQIQDGKVKRSAFVRDIVKVA
jgi:hypothetical protein